MNKSTNIKSFLENIMHISDTTMGGATAGIIGSSGANSDSINNLKKSAIVFAQEYHKPGHNQAELLLAAEQVNGCLHTLQLTNILSESTSSQLMDELEKLTDNTSV